ncbi:hypothetical protein BDM02DRAFT_3090709 [Thelephora ganbajun]|uniref:Uncharacterized protein n=1 Tax=Thelephora ganbajun TaxID=370292 RepID=A0ACB6ZP69_THEGA|nr:hypothetical protein BDM02DRAFT_3090709 [Thelephora ganbajun]
MHTSTSPDPAFHSPAVLELIDLRVTEKFTNHIAETTINAVDTALGYRSAAWNRTSLGSRRVPFKRFVSDVIRRASAKMPVLLVTLVYITRAKPYLHIETEDWACERVFLGALMAASKYTNDSTLRNVHWALATGVFGKRDVNRIEREFLQVLAWQLGFTQPDILAHYGAIASLYHDLPSQSSNTPPSLSPQPSPTTTTTSSVRYSQPKDTSTPIRKSTASYDLSSPPTLLYPVALATQPFLLKAEEARHPHSRPPNFTSFPLPWHGKNHSMHGQHTLSRISV